jgi:hypothetical protein
MPDHSTYMGFGEASSMEPVVSARKFVVPLFVLIGIAVLSGLIVGLNTGTSRSATPLPGDIPSPFQAAESGTRMVRVSYEPANYAPEPAIYAPNSKPSESWGVLQANPSIPLEPAWPAAAPAKSAKPDAAKSESTIAARRLANRPGYVLNDGQIASMKRRLGLTPDQEKLWPPVEAALRKIVYTKTAANAGASHNGRTEYVDPNSAEVQQLATAAQPLIRRLNDDHRREVKSLAFVMGLERLASAL